MTQELLDPASLQQLLYQALDSSDNIVLVLEQARDAAAGLAVVATNGAFCRLSGFTAMELVGRPFLSLAAREANPAVGAAIIKSALEQRSYRSELLCSRQSGAPFWLGLHLMPVHTRTPGCCVLLGRDITEILRDRQQHAAIQSLLAKVFVSVQAAIAIVDDHGTIVMTNPALDHLLGYQSGRLTGKPSADLVVPSWRAKAVAARQAQLESGRNYTIETAVLCADGSQTVVELTSTLVERGDLKRFRIITVMQHPPSAAAGTAPVSVHVAGKIRLIGLEEVKAALGPRWPAVSLRVMASAEHVVRRRCGPPDSWSRTVDGGFLICFGNATEDEAAFRAATIAREIRVKLIGEGEAESTAYVTAITGRVELPARLGQSPDMLAAAIAERLGARMAETETRARSTLQQAVGSATCELATVRRPTGEIVGYFATLPRQLERAVECALAALPAGESKLFDFDRLVLGVAAEQAIGQLASGKAHPIMVAVDFEVFLDRQRTARYVAGCQQLDARLRSRLILVLSRMPNGVPKSRVLECVMRLRPFCHAVGFQTESVELPPIEFSVLGASIVVLRESDLNAWEAEDLAKLDKLIGVVRAHRAHVLVRQVSSRENAMRLMKLGVDLVALGEVEGQVVPG